MIVPGASLVKGSELGGAAAVDVMQFPLVGGLAGWRCWLGVFTLAFFERGQSVFFLIEHFRKHAESEI